MLGVPGFESPVSDAPWQTPAKFEPWQMPAKFEPWQTPAKFERITPASAIEIARTAFDLDVLTVARLETERDDSFRLRTPTRDLVLKVAHPGDDAAFVDLQTKALIHAQSRDPGLPFPRLVETPDGATSCVLTEHDDRIARVFSWLPGTMLLDASPDDSQSVKLGDALGRLSVALRGFEHFADRYPLAWDLAQAQKLRILSERDAIPSVTEALDRHETIVVPLLDTLPRQVIHNDFNPGNVVVDADDPDYVVGLLDFGDVIQSIRVADLAVALSYQLFPLRRSWETCAPFIEGFEQRVLLLDDERAVLKSLVATRFAQRILINDWMVAQDTGRPADPLYRAGVLAALDQLLGAH